MARESQNLPYLFLGGVIVVAIVVFFVSLIPQYRTIQDTRVQIEDTKAQRVERRSFLDTIDRKANQLRSQAEHERELGTVLPAGQDVDDVLRIVDRRANEAGVVIASVTNTSESLRSAIISARARGSETNIPAGVVPLGAKVSVTGSYQQLRQFIDSLSSSVRLIDVTKISIAKGKEATGEILGLDMDLQFYSYESSSSE